LHLPSLQRHFQMETSSAAISIPFWKCLGKQTDFQRCCLLKGQLCIGHEAGSHFCHSPHRHNEQPRKCRRNFETCSFSGKGSEIALLAVAAGLACKHRHHKLLAARVTRAHRGVSLPHVCSGRFHERQSSNSRLRTAVRLHCSPAAGTQACSADINDNRLSVFLVVEGTDNLGKLFVERLQLTEPLAAIVVLPRDSFKNEERVTKLIAQIQGEHPGKHITGLVHFACCGQIDISRLCDAPAIAVAEVDQGVCSLMSLVGHLVPIMKASGRSCRIMTVSTESALMSPSMWSGISAAQSLGSSFVEQYTEALACELHGTDITVVGARITDLVNREVHKSQELAEQLQAAWDLQSAEAHGRILPVTCLEVLLRQNAIRGGSVLGPSVDVKWALRAAVCRVADYPPDARPTTYRALAEALGIPEPNLVWCHGASDVIIRLAAVASLRAQSSTPGKTPWALCQDPTWAFAMGLIKSGGLARVETIDYPEPDPLVSGSELGAGSVLCKSNHDAWWRELEGILTALDVTPPALVYLVHPHFPTGHKAPDFGARLAELVTRLQSRSQTTLFAVDQTYIGFTDPTADDAKLQSLAVHSESVAIIRSLSKVEGLAALRLGYAVASSGITSAVAGNLPFAGGLYISPLALEGAAAAISGAAAASHRADVLHFYQSEQQWFRQQIANLGFPCAPSPCPFFRTQLPQGVLRRAVKAGGAVQSFTYASQKSASMADAVLLVTDRATNLLTIEALRDAFEAEAEAQSLPDWIPAPLRSMLDSRA